MITKEENQTGVVALLPATILLGVASAWATFLLVHEYNTAKLKSIFPEGARLVLLSPLTWALVNRKRSLRHNGFIIQKLASYLQRLLHVVIEP